MSEHSDIVGGSTASRVLHCPASVRILQRMQEQLDTEADQLIHVAQEAMPNGPTLDVAIANAEKLRGSLNQSSKYADEGTGLHKVMEIIVDNDLPIEDLLTHAGVDEVFEEYELGMDRYYDAVVPAHAMFNKFLDEVLAEDGDEFLLRVESRVEFPGIDNAFGTCDILIRTTKRTIVWDWKFGSGVPVAASYEVETKVPAVINRENGEVEDWEDEVQEFGNDQLMYYGRAALNTAPEYFGDSDAWPVELVICQPRVSDEISRFTTTVADLREFELDLQEAVKEALEAPEPTQKRDDKWCRFAACKTNCKLHATSGVALAELGAKLGALRLSAAAPEFPLSTGMQEFTKGAPQAQRQLAYTEALATMLELREIVEPYLAEAEKQAHAFMEAGGNVPGFKLVPKRAGWDSWEDEQKADSYLGRQGLSVDERRVVKTITPAKARDLLKAKGLDMKEGSKDRKLFDKYVKKGVSSGTTIALDTDARPAVETTAATIEGLANKLKQIGG